MPAHQVRPPYSVARCELAGRHTLKHAGAMCNRPSPEERPCKGVQPGSRHSQPLRDTASQQSGPIWCSWLAAHIRRCCRVSLCACAGLDPTTLAVAIAVPVGVCLLAAGLLGLWCWRRKRKHRHQRQRASAAVKGPLPPATARDLETGHNGVLDAQRSRQLDQVGSQAATQADVTAAAFVDS